MADLAYTTAARVVRLAGQLAIDLRTDDADAATLLSAACDFASAQIDFYCGRYAQSELQGSRWVATAADFIAVRWMCFRRLNEVPGSIDKEWTDDLRPQLEQIQQGKASVPGAAASRRPVAVSNYHVDLNLRNKQVRTDRSRSTGVAQGYSRPTDLTAEMGWW